MEKTAEDERDQDLKKIRPTWHETTGETDVSDFENESVKQILKFQNSIVLAQFSQYLRKFKPGFYAYNQKVQYNFIQDVFKTDPRIRNSLIASVVSLMTLDEYAFYCENKLLLNKVIIRLIIERIKNNIEMLY